MTKDKKALYVPEVVAEDLATLRIGPDDEGYDRGEPHLAVVKARTKRNGRRYTSRMTGREAEGVRAAVAMLEEELALLVEDGLTVDALRRHYHSSEGKPPPKATAHLPRLGSLEQALDFPYEEPFVFERDDIPTPTGRTYKPYQTCVRVRCADGTDRVIHTSDRHQLVNAAGEVRSHEQVLADRRERARSKKQKQRKEAGKMEKGAA